MKIAVISDLHFAIKKSDKTFLQSQLRFFEEQLVPELKSRNIKNLFVLGDVFDTRQSVNVQTDNIVLKLFKETLKDFTCQIIVGNHDIYHTTTTEVNSLKMIDLLPNCHVYENPKKLIIDGKKCLMLPWMTDYNQFDEIVAEDFDYCFCHADIIGFDMGGGRLSDAGVPASKFTAKIKHTYSGHYHKRYTKEYLDGTSINYIGSPYQLTRIDRYEPRGITIIDIKTNEVEFVENVKSIRFIKFIYPEINKDMITGNVIDIDVPYDLSTETKKIYNLIVELEKKVPAYPINLNIMPKDVSYGDIKIESGDFNLLSLFKGYIDQLETKVDKKELYDSFMELFNMYKEDEK